MAPQRDGDAAATTAAAGADAPKEHFTVLDNPNLPAGWAMLLDPASGVPFYFNKALSQSQWTPPVVVPAAVPPPPAAGALAPVAQPFQPFQPFEPIKTNFSSDSIAERPSYGGGGGGGDVTPTVMKSSLTESLLSLELNGSSGEIKRPDAAADSGTAADVSELLVDIDIVAPANTAPDPESPTAVYASAPPALPDDGDDDDDHRHHLESPHEHTPSTAPSAGVDELFGSAGGGRDGDGGTLSSSAARQSLMDADVATSFSAPTAVAPTEPVSNGYIGGGSGGAVAPAMQTSMSLQHQPAYMTESFRAGDTGHAGRRRSASSDAREALPDGWERREDPFGKVYYVDHINKVTSWDPPSPRSFRSSPVPMAGVTAASIPVAIGNASRSWEPSGTVYASASYGGGGGAEARSLANGGGIRSPPDGMKSPYGSLHESPTYLCGSPTAVGMSGGTVPMVNISQYAASPTSVYGAFTAPDSYDKVPQQSEHVDAVRFAALDDDDNGGGGGGGGSGGEGGRNVGRHVNISPHYSLALSMHAFADDNTTPLCEDRARWRRTQDEEVRCQRCEKEFTMFRRRHHCRCCFRAVCDSCSQQRSAVLQFEHDSPVRVCVPCGGHLGESRLRCLPRLIPYIEDHSIDEETQIRSLREIIDELNAGHAGDIRMEMEQVFATEIARLLLHKSHELATTASRLLCILVRTFNVTVQEIGEITKCLAAVVKSPLVDATRDLHVFALMCLSLMLRESHFMQSREVARTIDEVFMRKLLVNLDASIYEVRLYSNIVLHELCRLCFSAGRAPIRDVSNLGRIDTRKTAQQQAVLGSTAAQSGEAAANRAKLISLMDENFMFMLVSSLIAAQEYELVRYVSSSLLLLVHNNERAASNIRMLGNGGIVEGMFPLVDRVLRPRSWDDADGKDSLVFRVQTNVLQLLNVLAEDEACLTGIVNMPQLTRVLVGAIPLAECLRESAAAGEGANDLCVATFDYVAEGDEELSFRKGERIVVTRKDVADGWWQGAVGGDASRTGLFPAMFVDSTASGSDRSGGATQPSKRNVGLGKSAVSLQRGRLLLLLSVLAKLSARHNATAFSADMLGAPNVDAFLALPGLELTPEALRLVVTTLSNMELNDAFKAALRTHHAVRLLPKLMATCGGTWAVQCVGMLAFLLDGDEALIEEFCRERNGLWAVNTQLTLSGNPALRAALLRFVFGLIELRAVAETETFAQLVAGIQRAELRPMSEQVLEYVSSTSIPTLMFVSHGADTGKTDTIETWALLIALRFAMAPASLRAQLHAPSVMFQLCSLLERLSAACSAAEKLSVEQLDALTCILDVLDYLLEDDAAVSEFVSFRSGLHVMQCLSLVYAEEVLRRERMFQVVMAAGRFLSHCCTVSNGGIRAGLVELGAYREFVAVCEWLFGNIEQSTSMLVDENTAGRGEQTTVVRHLIGAVAACVGEFTVSNEVRLLRLTLRLLEHYGAVHGATVDANKIVEHCADVLSSVRLPAAGSSDADASEDVTVLVSLLSTGGFVFVLNLLTIATNQAIVGSALAFVHKTTGFMALRELLINADGIRHVIALVDSAQHGSIAMSVLTKCLEYPNALLRNTDGDGSEVDGGLTATASELFRRVLPYLQATGSERRVTAARIIGLVLQGSYYTWPPFLEIAGNEGVIGVLSSNDVGAMSAVLRYIVPHIAENSEARMALFGAGLLTVVFELLSLDECGEYIHAQLLALLVVYSEDAVYAGSFGGDRLPRLLSFVLSDTVTGNAFVEAQRNLLAILCNVSSPERGETVAQALISHNVNVLLTMWLAHTRASNEALLPLLLSLVRNVIGGNRTIAQLLHDSGVTGGIIALYSGSLSVAHQVLLLDTVHVFHECGVNIDSVLLADHAGLQGCLGLLSSGKAAGGLSVATLLNVLDLVAVLTRKSGFLQAIDRQSLLPAMREWTFSEKCSAAHLASIVEIVRVLSYEGGESVQDIVTSGVLQVLITILAEQVSLRGKSSAPGAGGALVPLPKTPEAPSAPAVVERLHLESDAGGVAQPPVSPMFPPVSSSSSSSSPLSLAPSRAISTSAGAPAQTDALVLLTPARGRASSHSGGGGGGGGGSGRTVVVDLLNDAPVPSVTTLGLGTNTLEILANVCARHGGRKVVIQLGGFEVVQKILASGITAWHVTALRAVQYMALDDVCRARITNVADVRNITQLLGGAYRDSSADVVLAVLRTAINLTFDARCRGFLLETTLCSVDGGGGTGGTALGLLRTFFGNDDVMVHAVEFIKLMCIHERRFVNELLAEDGVALLVATLSQLAETPTQSSVVLFGLLDLLRQLMRYSDVLVFIARQPAFGAVVNALLARPDTDMLTRNALIAVVSILPN